MSERTDDELLRRAAQRAADRPFFVASDLAAYRELHQLGEEALAEFLGCPPEQLPRLALCRRPDPDTPEFRREVERIAEHVGARAPRLAQLLREVASLHALRRADTRSRGSTGALLAARDRAAGDAPSGEQQDSSSVPEERGTDTGNENSPQT